MPIKKETGEKREFSTGAKKQPAVGKGTPVLVPGDAILEVAKHFEEGAAVHGPNNWCLGIPLSEITNSLERHIIQFKMGLKDESHLRAIAWNAIVLLATKIRIDAGILPKELDDIYYPYGKRAINYLNRENNQVDLVYRTCLGCGTRFQSTNHAIVCLDCKGKS